MAALLALSIAESTERSIFGSFFCLCRVYNATSHDGEYMGLGKGALLWLIGIPIPIIILIAIFWH
jgi:hypothetical protein